MGGCGIAKGWGGGQLGNRSCMCSVCERGCVCGVCKRGGVRGIGDWGGVRNSECWGGNFSNWSSICQRSMGYRGEFGDRCTDHWSGCCIAERKSMGDGGGSDGFHGNRCCSDRGCSDWSCGNGFHSNSGCFFADDCVESVDWVSGVVDGAFGSISIDEGIAALDDISVASFLLAFRVTGQTVVHVVGIAVLRMRIIVGVDCFGYYRLSHGSGDYCLSHWGSS